MTDPLPLADDDPQVAELRAWFDRHGRQLTFDRRPDGRWFAFYPLYGQSVAAAPSEVSTGQLLAALAAKSALERQLT